jgi:uncharacterized protein (DUF1501 family)
MTAPLIDRRLLLAGALGCSAAASPLVTPVLWAAGPGETRFVVIVLRGAMDGLDAVRPVGDPGFAALRPRLLRDEAAPAADLDGFFALHAAFAPLLPLWRAGELAFAHAVATPYRDKRSHFDGQDLLETGRGDPAGGVGAGPADGWLNRMIGLMPDARAETALAVGRERLLLLRGAAPVRGWAPDGQLNLSSQARRLLAELYAADPAFSGPFAVAERMAGMTAEPDAMDGGHRGRTRALAVFAAARLSEEARVAAFSIGGWDTHSGQRQAIAAAMAELSDAILALRDGLGPAWPRTVVLCLTEFGRTARENGSGGTDHGTGGAALFAGGALAGARVHGRWPGLASLYRDRDLQPTEDVRRYAAWAARAALGLGRSALETTVFPGLDMGEDPRLIG